MRSKTTSQLRRGLAVLAVLTLGLAASGWAFGAAPVKKQIKKGATKILKQKIDDFGNPIFVEENEFDRFGPVKVQNGDAPKPLFTRGPFTATGVCELATGDVLATSKIATSEAGSFFYGYDAGEEEPFDPTDGVIDVWSIQGNPPGGAPTGSYSEHDGTGSVWAPSGTTLSFVIRILTNWQGTHCLFDGWLVDLTP